MAQNIELMWIEDSISDITKSITDMIKNDVEIPNDIAGMIMSVSTKLTILNAKSKRDIKRKFSGLTPIPN